MTEISPQQLISPPHKLCRLA